MTQTELKNWRASNAMTQIELAEALGVHPLTVAQWEQGKRRVPTYLHLALQRLEQGVDRSAPVLSTSHSKGETSC